MLPELGHDTLAERSFQVEQMTMRTNSSIAGANMIQRIPIAGALILAILLSGCGSMKPSEGDVALSGKEVKKLIIGNTLRSAWEAKQLTIVFYDNGVVRGSLGLSGSDSGTWTMEDDTYCHHWDRYFDATRHCYKWWRRKSDYLLQNVDAFRTPNLSGRIEPGKPSGY